MAIVKSKQLEGVVTTDVSGALFISASAAAYGFGSADQPWIVTGTALRTKAPYVTEITGSLGIFGTIGDLFLVKSNTNQQNLFSVSSSGIIKQFVHSTDPTIQAGYGEIYFTSSSFFIGVD